MLIFVQSKERAKELFHELIYDGINVDVIHSDRTQAQVSWMEHVSYNNVNLTVLFYAIWKIIYLNCKENICRRQCSPQLYMQLIISSCQIKPEKNQAWMGFEPMTSAIPVQCSSNWAIGPTGSCLSCVYNCSDHWCLHMCSYVVPPYLRAHSNC